MQTANDGCDENKITPLQREVELPRGILSLHYSASTGVDDSSNSAYQLDDLLGFAERINPKRAFLFVSKVLGRHLPVTPKVMRKAFSDLTKTVPNDLPEPILVIGMAETAVGLSAGVHQVLQKRYSDAILLNSTRHSQEGKLLTTFVEDHSHASNHLIYQSDDDQLQQRLLACKTLIMVDDEASTGNTCKNVVNGLRQAGLDKIAQVHLLTLVDWSLDKVQDNSFSGIDFYRHHLLSGSWQWTDKANAPKTAMPKLDSVEAGSFPLLHTGNWGRKPTLNSTQGVTYLLDNLLSKINIESFINKKVLVLGSNEFVWLPFLLAENLESKGCLTKFSALTRSPINVRKDDCANSNFKESTQNLSIKSKMEFKDNYGLNMINFVYNVMPEQWDLILLCVETPTNSVDDMWLAFDNLIVVTPE